MAARDDPHVLIVSHAFDPHVDQMVTMLKKLGVRCDRWVTSTFPCESAIALDLAAGRTAARLETANRSVDLTTVRSVWYRHPSPPLLPSGLDAEEQRFAQSEIRSALAGLFQLFDWFWINHPDRVRVAESKILQLRRARALGFEIPETLVTNDPAAVRGFFGSHRHIVYKPFTSAFFADGEKFCFTTPLARDEISHADLIRNAPGIFQKKIEKRVELRITMIGRRVFAAEIHSQAVDSAKDDWRAAPIEDLVHIPHKLPSDLEQRCLAYVGSFGLVFGAIDMIVTPENQYVFLENNPSGQFGWIEAQTGEPLTAALAELLIAGEVR